MNKVISVIMTNWFELFLFKFVTFKSKSAEASINWGKRSLRYGDHYTPLWITIWLTETDSLLKDTNFSPEECFHVDRPAGNQLNKNNTAQPVASEMLHIFYTSWDEPLKTELCPNTCRETFKTLWIYSHFTNPRQKEHLKISLAKKNTKGLR